MKLRSVMPSSKILAKRTLARGDVLDGKYRIEALIGRGGMGAVYLARHLQLDALRAIKLMRNELADDDEFVQRFHNEAKLVESLRHGNIVTLYDYAALDDGTQYIVWEYVEGETIRERLDRGERFTPGETLDIVRQIASGLAAAHEQGILHRDVSPENIMICKDCQAKVLDFGVAKSVVNASSSPSTLGLTFGKTGFASPEQRALRSGELLDARTDVFSLGAVTYAMLTGEAPFRTQDEPAFNHDLHLAPETEVRRRYLSRLPDRCWHEPLTKALARDREARPRTVDVYVRSLEAASDRHARGLCLGSEREQPRRRMYLLAAAAAVVASLGFCTSVLSVVPIEDLPTPPVPAQTAPALAPVTTPDQATRQQEAMDAEPRTPPPRVRVRGAPSDAGAESGSDVALPAGADVDSAEPSETSAPPLENVAVESPVEGNPSEPESGREPPRAAQPEVETKPTPRAAEPEPEPEPVFIPPRRIGYVPPAYPGRARRLGIQGDVVVEATITPEGNVTNVVVVRSVNLLDDAAVKAVRQWKFLPATKDGEPVESNAILTVTFQLQ